MLAHLNGHPFTQPYYDDYLYNNAVKLQLNDLENLTFRKVIEKYKEIEQMARDNAGNPYEIAYNVSAKPYKFKGKCYHCKKPGHVKTKCFEWLASDEGKPYNEDTASTAQSKGKKVKDGGKGEEKLRDGRRGMGRGVHLARKASGTMDSDSEDSDDESVYGRIAIDHVDQSDHEDYTDYVNNGARYRTS